jgi:hypothetical protein
MPTVPSHAHPLAARPDFDLRADLVHNPGNLMARDARVLNARPMTFLGQCIAVTDATRQDANAHLPGARLRHFALD